MLGASNKVILALIEPRRYVFLLQLMLDLAGFVTCKLDVDVSKVDFPQV